MRNTFRFAGATLGLLAGAGLAWSAAAQDVRGVSKTEIVLGTHTDLSGPAASYGVSSSNAMRMRVDEVNAAGGVHGRKIRLIIEDNQYQVPRAVQAANKLLNRDRVFAIIGAVGTPMNNAVMKQQLDAGVPNLFPITAAKQMAEPFHRLKFGGIGLSYYDHIRAGVKWMVESKGKKTVCALYQDTDYGQEVFEGARDQLKAMNMDLAATATHKPTDSDFTAQITRLRGANCDLVVAGTIVRDAILSYATARKMGWADVEFIGSAASYDQIVAGYQGGVTEGFHTMGFINIPYRDTANPQVATWFDRYKEAFGQDPAIGAVYGYTGMDMVILALDRAGPNLTVDSFVEGMESIQGYRDIFGGPEQSFGPNKRIGADIAYVYQVKNGRFERVSDAVKY